MPDQAIGTISAVIRLNLVELDRNVAEAKRQIADMAKDIEYDLTGLATKTGEQAAAMTATMQRSMATALTQVGTIAAGMGAAILGGLGAATLAGNDWNQQLLHISANTGMTREQTVEMQKSIEGLAGIAAPLERMADGYMHIHNFGYQAADATKILEAASRSAAATGADASKVSELLAGTMHNFGIQASDAASTMGKMTYAAARANATLEDFVSRAGRAYAVGHTYGISLDEVNASLITLTQHQYPMALAVTQTLGMMQQIGKPTGAAKKALEELGAAGVQLKKDFTFAGVGQGFAKIAQDIIDAADKAGISAEALTNKLIQGQRGGQAMQVLVRNIEELRGNLKQATAETWQFADAQISLAGQIQIVKNNMTILGGEIEKAILPVLRPALDLLHGLLQAFIAMPEWMKQVVVGFTALTGAVLAIGGALALAAGAFLRIDAAVTLAGFSLSAITAEIITFLPWIAAIGAAIALLVIAWNTDFLHIRSVVTGFINWIRPFVELGIYQTVRIAQQLWNDMVTGARGAFILIQGAVAGAINSIVSTVQRGVNMAVSALNILAPGIASTVSVIGSAIPAGLGQGVSAIGDTIRNHVLALNVARDGAQAAMNAMRNESARHSGGGAGVGSVPRLPSLPSAGGGGGGRGAKGASDDMKDIKARAEEAARAVADLNENIFKLTHTPYEIKVHDALAQFYDRTQSGVGPIKAARELALEIKAINADVLNNMREKSQEIANNIFKLTHSTFDVRRMEARQQRDKQIKDGADPKIVQQNYKMVLDEIKADEDKNFEERLEGHAKFWKGVAGFIKVFADQKAAQDEQVWRSSIEYTAQESVANTEAIAKARAEDEDMARVRYELNQRDYRDYVTVLTNKIAGLRIYSEEWKRVYDEIGRITKRNVEENMKQQARQLDNWQRMLIDMKQQTQDILANSFMSLFEHGFKGFFDSILKGFTHMLEEMVAQLLAKAVLFGILSIFTGGGVEGFKSFGSFLGFDDWGNDQKAKRWGYDFGNMFTSGIQDFGAHNRLAPQGAGGSAPANNTVHVNVHVGAVNQNADIDRLGERIAWHVQQRLPSYVV